MAHMLEIDNVTGAASMFYAADGGRPWHGLGTEVQEAPTMRDAIKLANMDWLVEKHPLYVHMDVGGNRTTRRIEDKFATVRVSDGKVLGIVAKEYKVLNNIEAFTIIDEVVKELGIEVRYETAGVLDGGKQIFITAQLPKVVKVGKTKQGDPDLQFPYLMLRSGHDGFTALDILPTSIRPVCWNTVTMAINERGRYGMRSQGITLWHMGDTKSMIENAMRALNLSIELLDQYGETAQKLEGIAATDEMVSEFINIVIPPIALLPAGRITPMLLPAPDPNRWVKAVPQEAFDKATTKRTEYVSIFKQAFDAEQPSAWGLFNAATGYADHLRPHMWRKPEALLKSNVIAGEGVNLKRRAWEGIRELAGV